MFRNSCAKKIATLYNKNDKNIFEYFRNHVPLRSFFSNGLPLQKTKIYRDKKIVGFSMNQMYNVVSDVGNYKYFVPFCKKSMIISEKPGFLHANLEIGFPPIYESYHSHVTLAEPYLVKSSCVDGKIFDHLETTWKFSPALKSNPQSCIIDFYVSFEFRSLLHSQLANIFFDKLVQQMEGAFINEARVRYGSESLASKRLGEIERR